MDHVIETVTEQAYAESVDANDSVYERFKLEAVWDGCIHISGYRDGKRDGYLHICDLDAYIKTLVDFRNRATAHHAQHNGEWSRDALTVAITPPDSKTSPGRST